MEQVTFYYDWENINMRVYKMSRVWFLWKWSFLDCKYIYQSSILLTMHSLHDNMKFLLETNNQREKLLEEQLSVRETQNKFQQFRAKEPHRWISLKLYSSTWPSGLFKGVFAPTFKTRKRWDGISALSGKWNQGGGGRGSNLNPWVLRRRKICMVNGKSL